MKDETLKGVAPSPGSRQEQEQELEPHAEVLQVLRLQDTPLFVLLDSARDPRILDVLGGADEPRASLYTGPEGETLADVAPYLVALPPGSELLGRLLEEGWGKSWGVFLTSSLPFRDLRRHFRRFLLVEDEQGNSLYFRFYDPRVLRVFLETCTPEQRAELFGSAVARFLLEDFDARLLSFDAPRPNAGAGSRPSNLEPS